MTGHVVYQLVSRRCRDISTEVLVRASGLRRIAARWNSRQGFCAGDQPVSFDGGLDGQRRTIDMHRLPAEASRYVVDNRRSRLYRIQYGCEPQR